MQRRLRAKSVEKVDEVKRVTSTSGEVEDPENPSTDPSTGSETGGNQGGGNTNQGGNQGGNSGGGGDGDDENPIDDD